MSFYVGFVLTFKSSAPSRDRKKFCYELMLCLVKVLFTSIRRSLSILGAIKAVGVFDLSLNFTNPLHFFTSF